MLHPRVIYGLWLIPLCSFADSSNIHYVGAETCVPCHKKIAVMQERTAMAKTWSGRNSAELPPNLDARIGDGSARAFEYRLYRQNDGLAYSVHTPQGAQLTLPVDIVMGGERHGLGFLIKVDQITGLRLERPTLIQTRYFWSFKPGGGLVFAPGLSPDPPHSYESALGLVLSPGFEQQCLACHGQPNGVRCESCHGPGSQHVDAVAKGQPAKGILNPRRLQPNEGIEVCAPCHAGFGRHIDSSPDDLLIANQVQALRSSECFIQSGRSFSCTSCHDPHRDAAGHEDVTTRTCLGCHSKDLAQRAAVCPVNAKSGCTGCHMPSVDVGPLHLVDHQIRVHPEQNVTAPIHDESLRSQRRPVWEYLRVIRNEDRAKVVDARRRVEAGESFYDVARALSADSTASVGGFLGGKETAKLEPALLPVAARLHYGDLSGITQLGASWYLIQRMPRDFKWQAEQIQQDAETLLARGDLVTAIDKSQQALKVYPHFRRALTFVGTTLARGGNLERAAQVLGLTSRLYPADAVSLFTRGVVLDELNRRGEAIDAYRRALVLEPDLLAAYAKLGTALQSSGDEAAAIAIFRQGLKINPLSAELYRDLSAALARQGDIEDTKRCAALAALLDPK